METQARDYNVKKAVPFCMVRNMKKSLDFYLEGLNFELKNKWDPHGSIEWCLLQIDHASIMLQSFSQNSDVKELGRGVSIYFICEDALKIYDRSIAKGLPVSEPIVGNAMWVVGLSDPDGYQIYFESLTDVPEETMYSDWIRPDPSKGF